MKVELIFSDENANHQEPVTIEWDCQFLPRKGEIFNLDEFIPLSDAICMLTWEVGNIFWIKSPNGEIMVSIDLLNEYEVEAL